MTALSESFYLTSIHNIFSWPISTFLPFSQIRKPVLDTWFVLQGWRVAADYIDEKQCGTCEHTFQVPEWQGKIIYILVIMVQYRLSASISLKLPYSAPWHSINTSLTRALLSKMAITNLVLVSQPSMVSFMIKLAKPSQCSKWWWLQAMMSKPRVWNDSESRVHRNFAWCPLYRQTLRWIYRFRTTCPLWSRKCMLSSCRKLCSWYLYMLWLLNHKQVLYAFLHTLVLRSLDGDWHSITVI